MKQFLSRIFFALCLAMSLQSYASTSLSQQDVQNWIQSQKALAKWGEQHAATLDAVEQDSSGPQNPFDMSIQDMLKPLERSGLAKDAEQLIQRYGFDSLEDWAEATLRITKAAAAIQVEGQEAQLDTAHLEALKNSGRLSPQEQAMINQAIEQNQSILHQLQNNVTDADKSAVRPLLKELQELMNEL